MYNFQVLNLYKVWETVLERQGHPNDPVGGGQKCHRCSTQIQALGKQAMFTF